MKAYDVLGIGNPLLDFIVEVDDEFLKGLDLRKGAMHLINEEQSKQIREKIKSFEKKIAAGGSAANVVAGVGCLGGKGTFFGAIGDDDHGNKYETLSKQFDVDPWLARHSLPTGHAITFITPDFNRTFTTFLGAALNFSKEDILENVVKNAKILHIEAFQLDTEKQAEAVVHAMKIAKENNVKNSIGLCNVITIEKNLALLKKLVKEYGDVVFMNEDEAEVFTNENDPLKALKKVHDLSGGIVVLTLGEKGSLIMENGKIHEIPVTEAKEVNTNGAGDMYTAGILHGIANGLEMDKVGKLASYAASKVVESHGARLEKSLKDDISTFIS